MIRVVFPWQQQQWQYLTNRINNKTLPHAILLKGSSGLGKSTFALSLAAFLLCEQKQLTSSVCCGTCKSCKLIQANTHPDLHLLQLTDEHKVIKIEQVREIIDITSKKSHQSGYQLIIIDPADSMNIAASNALLKTLEEPSDSTVFILVSSRPSAIPITIRSRCQHVIFNAPSKHIAETWLQKKNVLPENIDLLLSLTENAPLLSLQLAQGNFIQQRSQLLENLNFLLRKQLDPIKFATLFVDMDLRLLLSYLYSYFMDILRIKFNLSEQIIVNSDYMATLYNLSSLITITKIFSSLDKILIISKYADNNLNRQLLLEDLGIAILN